MSKFIQLSFPQGDDKHYSFRLSGSNGEPINLVGASVESQIRKTYDSDVVATFDCVVSDPQNGKLIVSMDNSTSSNLPVSGSKSKFVFDIEITYSNGDKAKVVYGNLIITREVTR